MVIALLSLLSSGPVLVGTPDGDVPMAARLLPDGTVAVVIQTVHPEDPLSYSLVLVSPGCTTPEMALLDTGMEDPPWATCCFWTSDSTFVLTLSSTLDRENEPDILTFRTGPDCSATLISAVDPVGVSAGDLQVSSAGRALDGGLYITVDRYGEYGEDLQSKTLLQLGSEMDTVWSAEVPCSGWWMNGDLIRTFPGGGCAVASDEDGFSETLYISRFTDNGLRLWSLDYLTGGEMTHSMSEMLPASDGCLLAVGVTDLFSMRYHSFILLVDGDGRVVRETLEDGLGHLYLTCGVPLDDGRFFLAGWTSEAEDGMMTGFREMACYVVVNGDGEVESITREVDVTLHEPKFLLPSEDGFIVVGTAWEDDYYGSDVYLEHLEGII